MSNVRTFIPKENQELPDSYGITIQYLGGGSDKFDAASHRFFKDNDILELVTTEDEWHLIPVTSIKRLSFDKAFSKMVAMKAEQSRKEG